MDTIDNGLDIAFVAVNAISAEKPLYQSKLIYTDWDEEEPSEFRCTYPLFQDTEEDGVWDLHDAGKDDIFVYDPTGKLSSFIPTTAPNTNLSTTEGYQNLTLAILKAAGLLGATGDSSSE